MDGGEDVVLTRHVMRARRQRPERRAAEDELATARAKEIGQIRMAAWKLLDFHVRQFQIRSDLLPVELFGGANGTSVAHFIRTMRATIAGKSRWSRMADVSFPPTWISRLRLATPSMTRRAHCS